MEKEIQEILFDLADCNFKEFHCKLIPTVSTDRIIGVKTPKLRDLASKIQKYGKTDDFLAKLPHFYYEENNLHGFLIEKIKDYNICIEKLDDFLPYVDNWATCDSISPKVFEKNKELLINKIQQWLSSDHIYTVRFGICMLIKHYLDGCFSPEHLEWVSSIKIQGEYYIDMAIAWYFSVALVKQYEYAVKYLENQVLSTWIHNKTISKAIDSFRITNHQKKYLRSLKIK